MEVWQIVQRAVFDRAAVPNVKLFLWRAGGGAGRKPLDAAGGADGGCLCGPQQSVLRRALPRVLEVQGFNECFMLNLAPALFTVQRLHVLFLSAFHQGEKPNPGLLVKKKKKKIKENESVFSSKRKKKMPFEFKFLSAIIKIICNLWFQSLKKRLKLRVKIFLYSSPFFLEVPAVHAPWNLASLKVY